MQNEYVTSRGVKVKFLGVASLIDAQQAALNALHPKPPTYVVKGLAGEEIHEHDDSTDKSPEQAVEYAAYKTKLAEWQATSQKEFMQLVMLRGIEFEMPRDDAWKRQQKFLHINIPENTEGARVAGKLHYLETEVLGGTQDYMALVTGVMRVSGVPEELLTQIESSFRGSLERATAVAVKVTTRGMELQPKV